MIEKKEGMKEGKKEYLNKLNEKKAKGQISKKEKRK